MHYHAVDLEREELWNYKEMILTGNIMGDPHSPLKKAEDGEKGEITPPKLLYVASRKNRKWR